MCDYDIDIEVLITLVQGHPILWDKTLEDYKNKSLTSKAWHKISSILIQKYQNTDKDEKTEICKSIQKKWTNVRDAWKKSIKKDKGYRKSASFPKSVKKYIYHDKMLFLQKTLEPSDGVESKSEEKELLEEKEFILDEYNIEESVLIEPQASASINFQSTITPRIDTKNLNKKRKVDNFEAEIEDLQIPKGNRHMCFFKGILPSIADFDEDQTIDFQMGVLTLIKNIKRSSSRSGLLNNRCYTFFPAQNHGFGNTEHDPPTLEYEHSRTSALNCSLVTQLPNCGNNPGSTNIQPKQSPASESRIGTPSLTLSPDIVSPGSVESLNNDAEDLSCL